jgi:HPt (histidine-containing phosphotransfer) domain-containing protein
MIDDGLSVLDSTVIDALRQLNEEGQPDVVEEVLGLFVAEWAGRLEAVESAIRAGDAPGLQRAAHTLKGASGAIGAIALQAACRALEELAKRHSFDEAPAAAETMREEYRRLRDAIDQLL